MTTKTLESPETALSDRKTSLGAFIKRINKAIGNEFENRIEVGMALKTIEDDELFRQENFAKFRDFVEEIYEKPGIFDYKQARRLINIAERVIAIRRAIPEGSDIPQPSSESQIRELLAYNPDEAAEIYVKHSVQAKKANVVVTGSSIKEFRTNTRETREIETEPKSWSAEPVETEPDTSDIDFSNVQPKHRNKEATATLERIEEMEKKGLLPKGSRAEIENEHVTISEGDLADWGRRYEEEATFVRIGRLILDSERVSFTNAYKLVNKKLDEETVKNLRLFEFILLSKAAGGSGRFELLGYSVSAQPIAKK